LVQRRVSRDYRAVTYINDNTVVCILEDILTSEEDARIAAGAAASVIDGRIAFQTDREDAEHA
jgi:hypothetical protein